MPRKCTKDEIRELAASYALGNLDESETKEFEELLRKKEGAVEKELSAFSEVAEYLLYAAGPLEAPKGLEKRFFSELKKAKREDRHDEGFLYVRKNEGEWVEVVKGVRVKQLYDDPARHYSTVLVKMEPGSRFPDHVHSDTEECYIIEGDIQMGGRMFHGGDYIRADARSVHEGISTVNGCFLLVQASQHNEMIL